MARWITGETIVLIDKIASGKNPLGRTQYQEERVLIPNVIISYPQAEDIETSVNLTGRRAEHVLGIPKGDTHDWNNKEVEFYGKRWRVIGTAIQGMNHLMPLDWNKKVMVESYEQYQSQT